jgi:hypothetical protein
MVAHYLNVHSHVKNQMELYSQIDFTTKILRENVLVMTMEMKRSVQINVHQILSLIGIKTPLKNVHVQQEKHMSVVRTTALAVEKMQLLEYVQKIAAKQETAHQQMVVILA